MTRSRKIKLFRGHFYNKPTQHQNLVALFQRFLKMFCFNILFHFNKNTKEKPWSVWRFDAEVKPSTSRKPHCNNILCSNREHCYHDQDSVSERPSGLKRLLVVFVLVLPLNALFDDWTWLWGFLITIQEEQTWRHVLHGCKKEIKGSFTFWFSPQNSSATTHQCTNITHL